MEWILGLLLYLFEEEHYYKEGDVLICYGLEVEVKKVILRYGYYEVGTPAFRDRIYFSEADTACKKRESKK